MELPLVDLVLLPECYYILSNVYYVLKFAVFLGTKVFESKFGMVY